MLLKQQTIQFSSHSTLYDLIVPKENILRKINDLIDVRVVEEQRRMKGLYFIQMIVSDDYADRRQSVRYNNARELKQDIIMHGVGPALTIKLIKVQLHKKGIKKNVRKS